MATKLKQNRVNPKVRDVDGRYAIGNPGGPGRTEGSISPTTKVRQIFREDPNGFKKWVQEYIKDPRNRKHIVEMLDGSPKRNVDVTSKGERIYNWDYGENNNIQTKNME